MVYQVQLAEVGGKHILTVTALRGKTAVEPDNGFNMVHRPADEKEVYEFAEEYIERPPKYSSWDEIPVIASIP